MGKYDRCSICDYCENLGSGVAGVAAGEYGRVRLHEGVFLCEACSDSIHTTVIDGLSDGEELEEE